MSDETEFKLAQDAEAYLAANLTRLQPATTKLAAFQNDRGRQLALALERREAIYLWAEACPPDMEGIEINNVKRPKLPYAPDQARSSAVNSQCSRLAEGNKAWYLRCTTMAALERFIRWYAAA
ncbi:hypothetical protein H8N03_06850 [Ramlibacter sp. USB13]|uniref:Uncharacterized protein n=1 Tax=Ramlibacter cellulosilyticus TaxID=2764187 RepID=A0A923MN20_9BURK|nr:hypothetical protein [Ramlibacter cellulosilyticus]MBC5782657.1 hypothetical protein [Ramlibacter cellulosilyticus]